MTRTRALKTTSVLATAVALLFFNPGPAASQTCDPQGNAVTANVFAADGSTPDSTVGPPMVYALPGHPNFQYQPGWGMHTFYLGPGHWVFRAEGADYLATPDYESTDCSNDPLTGCVTCTGNRHYDLPMWAGYGNIVGKVITVPAGTGSARFQIQSYQDGPISPYTFTDSAGTYNFARSSSSPVALTNDWGVPVNGTPGGNAGPGSKAYTLAPIGYDEQLKTVTVFSSTPSTANFCVVGSGTERFDIRGEPGQSTSSDGIAPEAEPEACSAPSACGRPVSVVTGNMFFDQTDATIGGLGGLNFTRSYNSANRAITSTLFGAGWFSTYERRLEAVAAYLLKLRQGSGVVAYFADPDGDLRFDATYPFSTSHWIEKQPDGSFRRVFRSGAFETYDSTGRLTSLVDPSGNATTLVYLGGALTTITAPSTRALTLGYTGGRVTTLTGPAGLIASYGYDGSGRLQTVTYADAAGSGYRFTYDPPTGAIATVEDLSGRFVEKHLYDGAGRAYTSEIADGQERYTFTYQTNQTSVTNALGKTTTYEYKDVGGRRRVTRISGACEGCGGGTETQQWSYSDWVTTRTDAEGQVTTYTYDPATGDLVSVTESGGPLTRSTDYLYDGAGRLLRVAGSDRGQTSYVQSAAGPTSIEDPILRTTSIGYDSKGQPETITNPRLKTTRLTYDPTKGDLLSVADPLNLTTSFAYDAMGRRMRVTDPLTNATTYTYDVRGHLTRITFPDTKFVSFTYDKGGRRQTATDALNRVTTYDYDAYGRLATVTDAATPAGVTRYGYDAMSRLTTLTDARNQVTTFEYDDFGRVIEVTYPGSPVGFETFTYYPSGRLKTRTDRKNVTTTYLYDGLGRLTDKSYSDGTPAVTYSYDLAGRMLTVSDAVDSLEWVYDLAGQMRSEASARNASILEYDYDDSGNRVELRADGSLVLSYVYDDADRLTTLTRGSSNWVLGYDAASRRTSLQHPNTVKATYAYDVVSRLTSMVTKKGNSNRTQSTYTYDAVGNRLTKGGDFSESYTYDPLHRLTQAKRGKTVTETYTYDPVGNRLSAKNSSPWGYDDRNQLLSLPGTTFSYDPNGNTTQKVDASGTWTYERNAENKLTRVLKNSVEQARFAYDPLGRRVEKVAGSTTTGYLYDGEDILRETVNALATTYIHGPGFDEPLAREDGAGNRSYYHADGLGSLVKETNSAGTVTLTRKYDAFGNLQLGTNSGFAYTGREWDAETGLYYYRARYYDPKVGRFLSEDPIGFYGGVNFYAYVENNPLNWTDPEGLCPVFRPGPWMLPPSVRHAGGARRPPTATPPRPYRPVPQPGPGVEDLLKLSPRRAKILKLIRIGRRALGGGDDGPDIDDGFFGLSPEPEPKSCGCIPEVPPECVFNPAACIT